MTKLQPARSGLCGCRGFSGARDLRAYPALLDAPDDSNTLILFDNRGCGL